MTIRPNDKGWFTTELRRLKRKLIRSFKKWKIRKNDSDYLNYKSNKNSYYTKIEEAKKLHEQKIRDELKLEKGSKKWWSILKNIYKNKTINRSIPPFRNKNTIVADDKEKANLLNKHFSDQSHLEGSN